MNKNASYQDLRSHLAYLKLAAVAEHLPAALEQAEKDKPGYTQFPARPAPGRGRRHRTTAPRWPHAVRRLPIHQDPGGVRLHRPTRHRPQARQRARHAPVRAGKSQLVADWPTGRWQDNARDRARPQSGRGRLPRALHDRRRPRRPHQPTADQGRWENTMRFWAGPQVLIVDELGYLPMVGEAGSQLFQVISRRYLHGTVILTTNRGTAEWGTIFEDTTVAVAILDRLLHHATVLQIDGESCRMRGHRAKLQQLRRGPSAESPGQD